MKIWLVTIAERRKYFGSPEYADHPEEFYSYDSFVQNHKRVQPGDLFVIRVGEKVTGVGRLSFITSQKGARSSYKCPECSTLKVRYRKTISPPYRCDNGHIFEKPSEEKKEATLFSAYFRENFIPLVRKFDWHLLVPFFATQSVQSIRPLKGKFYRNIEDQNLLELKRAIETLSELGGFESNKKIHKEGPYKPKSDFFTGPRDGNFIQQAELRKAHPPLEKLKNFLDRCRSEEDTTERNNNKLPLPLSNEDLLQVKAEVEVANSLSKAPKVEPDRFKPGVFLLERLRDFLIEFSKSAGKAAGYVVGPLIIAEFIGLIDAVLEIIKSFT